MNSKLANTKKGSIEYILEGNGPAVMILHGTSSDCFTRIMGTDALLNSGFAVISPSRPGYGKTPGNIAKTAEEAADAMISLLDSLNIEKVFLVAISGGGPTAIHMAAKYPTRIRKLVLAAAMSNPEEYVKSKRYKQVKIFYGPFHNFTWKMLRNFSIKSPEKMVRQTMILFSNHDINDIMANTTEREVRFVQEFYGGNSSAKGAWLDYSHRTGSDILNKIEVPTLILHSRDDNGVPFQQAEHSNRNIRNSELYIAKTWGHFLWCGPGSDEVDQKIIEFLKV